MVTPVLGDPATDGRRRAVPRDVDFADYRRPLAPTGKPDFLTNRGSARRNVEVHGDDQGHPVIVEVAQRCAVGSGVEGVIGPAAEGQEGTLVFLFEHLR